MLGNNIFHVRMSTCQRYSVVRVLKPIYILNQLTQVFLIMYSLLLFSVTLASAVKR